MSHNNYPQFAKDRLEDIKRLGKRFRGRRELIAHYQGKALTIRQAVAAQCYDCQGYMNEGAIDCDEKDCVFYPWMPYRKEKPAKKARSERQAKADALLAERTRGKRASNQQNTAKEE